MKRTTILFEDDVAPPTDISDMPRYVIEAEYASGETYWRYNPPKSAIDAGIVERVVLGHKRIKAWAKADDFNKALDNWMLKDNDHQRKAGILHSPTVDGLCERFLKSRFLSKLVLSTQKDYKYFLGCLCKTEIHGVPLGAFKYAKLERATAAMAYDMWCEQGPTHAEHIRSAARRVWNLADTQWGLLYANPWKGIEPALKPKRDVKWTQDQIQTFLNMAFSRYEWRNVGVCMLLAYELGQRLGDMRTMEWANYTEHTQTLHFIQSKTKKRDEPTRMALKLNPYLSNIMKDQYKDFGDTEFIAPHPGTGVPYSLTLFSKTGQRIREAAGLPDHLRMMDMRRTAVNESLLQGYSADQVMTMTGHKSLASMKPYIVQDATIANKVVAGRNTLTSQKDT